MLLPLLAVAKLVAFTPNLPFPAIGESFVTTLPVVDFAQPFNEAIVSWNVDHPEQAAVKVEVRATAGDHTTKWYTVADWAWDSVAHSRVSVNGQKDEDGTVYTDTLHLYKPATKLEIQVTLKTLQEGPKPSLRLVTAMASDTTQHNSDAVARSSAWGKSVPVMHRNQMDYPNGGGLCSATTVSMLLNHYSHQPATTIRDFDVPEVQSKVWDQVYNGAGNWPFNTAFAGSLPGMRGYVSRLNAISDLEKWIDAGLPVACSVSNLMLHGKPLTDKEQGHLVLLVGFTEAGDPIINDPGTHTGDHKVYLRSDFEKAWLYSKRTVYFIYPESTKVPANTDGLWVGE